MGRESESTVGYFGWPTNWLDSGGIERVYRRAQIRIPIGIVNNAMKVSSKATYGILAALDLALHNGTSPVQAKSIARRQAIPGRFLEQVLHAMKHAGLVDGLRGAQGGYVLNKRPADISLAEIVEALDGPLSQPARRLTAGASRDRTKPELLLATVWEQVRQAELNVLSAVTLKELAERHQELERERTLMYHI